MRISIYFLLFLLFLFSCLSDSNKNDYLKNDSSIYVQKKRKIEVKKNWKDFIIQNIIPIKSLESDDYKDSLFLKEILQDKRIVMLGENNHFVSEYNKLKTRIIKFLHDEMDFKVIAFESGIAECSAVEYYKDSLNEKEILLNSVYWKNPENLELSEYIKKNKLHIIGFDPQRSSDIYPNYLKEYFKKVYPKIAEFAYNTDTITKSFISKYNIYNRNIIRNSEYEKKKIILKSNYNSLISIIKDSIDYNRRNTESKIIIKSLENRINNLNFFDKKDAQKIRDKYMAENIEWIINELYKDEKIIIWAANFHIAKHNSNTDVLGEFLSDKTIEDSYIISLYMYSGTTGNYRNEQLTVITPNENSLEAILSCANYKISFLDLTPYKKNDDDVEWMFNDLETLGWGTFIVKVKLKQAYDAVILIDSVSPSVKL